MKFCIPYFSHTCYFPVFFALIKIAILQDVISNLSCEFNHDTCGWTITTELLDENPAEEGWVIFSPSLDGNQYRDHSPSGRRYLLAHTAIPMRTHAISRLFLKPEKEAQQLSFEYFAENKSELVIYVLAKYVNESENSFLWSNSKDPIVYDQWNSVQIPFLCQVVKDATQFRLSFVAFLAPGNAVGVANVSSTRLEKVPPECNFQEHPHQNILQFIVVFFIFLLFGSLFLTAILMMSRRFKGAADIPDIQISTYHNPSFAYRKLGVPFQRHPTIPEDDAEL